MKKINYMRRTVLSLGVLSVVMVVSILSAQSKPVTNEDVKEMIRNGLSESIIVKVIQTSPARLDSSPGALIALKNAGATEGVIDAVLRASTAATPAPSPNSAPQPSPNVSGPASVVLLGEPSAKLPLERTQLAQTKTKATSLRGLNGSVTGQAVQAGVNTAAWEGEIHSGSIAGSVAAGQAGGILGNALSHRPTPTVTYVWAIPGAGSPFQTSVNTPRFQVDFAGMMNINPDEFEPAIVKLTPTSTQPAARLVGATQGKDDAASKSAADWPLYSTFMEDQAATQKKKLASGHYEIAVATPLEPGEYAVVLRPISRTVKFSGAEIARDQGAGKVFNSAWSFRIHSGVEVR